MTITTRKTRYFIEIEVDETETTIFTKSPEIELVIENMFDVVFDLSSYTDKNINDFLKEYCEKYGIEL